MNFELIFLKYDFCIKKFVSDLSKSVVSFLTVPKIKIKTIFIFI